MRYTEEELRKMVKKFYFKAIYNWVSEMSRSICVYKESCDKLKEENKKLKERIEVLANIVNSDDVKIGLSLSDYIKKTIKNEVMDHFNVDIGRVYDFYGGSDEHEVNKNWNE